MAISSGIIPYRSRWKSNLSKLICQSSKSNSPEIFVRRLVNTLYKRLGDYYSFPINIELISKELDVKNTEIITTSYYDEEFKLSPFMDGYKITIKTNGKKQDARNRFGHCHELGHILLDKYLSFVELKKFDLYFENSNDFKEEERLCDEIASEILMPYDIFRLYALEKKPSLSEIDTLCNIFGVSRSVVIRRLLKNKLWDFDIVCWDISGSYFNPIEVWNPCKNITKTFLRKIVDDRLGLEQTYINKKPIKEDWTRCIVEFFYTKMKSKSMIVSLFFSKD